MQGDSAFVLALSVASFRDDSSSFAMLRGQTADKEPYARDP